MSSDDLDQIAEKLALLKGGWIWRKGQIADALRHQREMAFAEMEIALQEIEHDHAAAETKLAEAQQQIEALTAEDDISEGLLYLAQAQLTAAQEALRQIVKATDESCEHGDNCIAPYILPIAEAALSASSVQTPEQP